MRKKRILRAIIEGYIAICQMEGALKHFGQDELLKTKITKIKRQYEQVLFKAGEINLSFQILKQNMLIDENKLKINIKGSFIKQKISFFEEDLKTKMKKLHFSEFEINYVKNCE